MYLSKIGHNLVWELSVQRSSNYEKWVFDESVIKINNDLAVAKFRRKHSEMLH